MSKIGGLISRAWGVEQSAVDNTPKISLVVGGELMIENHGGIDKISDDEVKFLCGVSVSGRNLCIDWIEKDKVVIFGRVYSISCKGAF